MGTRALIHIKDETGHALATIYRQYDGYPTGLGVEIATILHGAILINGIGDEDHPAFNGMGCLAAFLISKLKKKIGDVYMYPVGIDNVGEEFTYKIDVYKSKPWLTIIPAFHNGEAGSFDLSDMGTIDDIKAYQKQLYAKGE